MKAALRRLVPNRLAVWLALTIVAGLVAIQITNVALVVLARPAAIPTVAARWLADHIADAARTAGPDQLAASPASDDLTPWFTVQWASRPGWLDTPRRGPQPEAALRRMIEQRLEEPGWHVFVDFAGPPLPFGGLMPHLLGPQPAAPRPPGGRRIEGRDFLVPASMVLAVHAPDGRWLVAEGRYGWSSQDRLAYFIASLAVFSLVIGLIAWWAARRLIRPLNMLGAAVRQLGETRQPAPVREQGPEEVRLIARSVNDMQVRIKRFIDERIAMASAMSHDLRTPLTRLRLRAELAPDDELRRKLLTDVDEIEGIVDDALMLARYDAPSEAPVKLDLSVLLRGLCDDAADAGQNAEFEGEDGIRIEGRPTALRRALANLVENAAKYGGCATVAVKRDGAWAVITIADEGPGIPDEHKEHVFDAFHRLEESRNRGTGGTGLGLTIARSIIEAHGGTVALADRQPHGLLVIVRLKLPAA